jgi:hypothetical protein
MKENDDLFLKQVELTQAAIDDFQRHQRINKATIDGLQKTVHYLCEHMKKNFQWTNEVEENVEKLSLEMLDAISMHTGDQA